MDDVLDALVAQESGRFFAADAAGAEHRDPLARETIGIGAPPAGKVAEAFGFGIDRACEAAIADLEPVARVDEHRVRIVDERVPVGGIDIGRRIARSEEHTSELQSLMRISYAVFCLKKKKSQDKTTKRTK